MKTKPRRARPAPRLRQRPAAPPVVTNIRAAQLAGTKNVKILYDVSDAEGDALTIAVQVSGDAGVSYTLPATALSGNVGSGVSPGLNRRIVWNAGADWNGQLVSSAKVRVTASDGTTPAPPHGMVYIPAGVFQMGDNLDGLTDAPVHNVTLDAFFMDRTEVAKELWQLVQVWSNAHGYGISGGSYYAAGHPVQSITWYDVVKWCNARSEKDGPTPCYYTDTAQTVIYKAGNVDVTNAMVKWTANGYRLPGLLIRYRLRLGEQIKQDAGGEIGEFLGVTMSLAAEAGERDTNAIVVAFDGEGVGLALQTDLSSKTRFGLLVGC